MNKPTIQSTRWMKRKNKYIGVKYLDNSHCLHCTEFCKKKCYNIKARKQYKNKYRNYLLKTGMAYRSVKNFPRGRFRLCKDGEPLNTLKDFERVTSWARNNPQTTFWIPTRAWRKYPGHCFVLSRIPNVRLLCSIDPSNTMEEIEYLERLGLSTMFFGNDRFSPQANPIKCKKTWEKSMGHCAKCKGGCFSASSKSRVDIWLKKH